MYQILAQDRKGIHLIGRIDINGRKQSRTFELIDDAKSAMLDLIKGGFPHDKLAIIQRIVTEIEVVVKE